MDEKAHASEGTAQQAIHDRSVIDRVVHIFSAGRAPMTPRAPVAEHSASVYHQIRRVWPER